MKTTQPQTTSRKASSIDQFCHDHGFSRATFYKLAKAGLAPRTMRVGTRQLISEEEGAAWRAQLTAANNKSAAA
jgi:predicted DNA-binding transcriptional regulator AlpA